MMNWIIISLVSLLAGIIQTVTGFGAGIVITCFLTGILGFLGTPAFSSVTCAFLSAGLVIRYRKHINWPVILPALIIYTSISVATLFLVKKLDLKLLQLFLGVFLTLLSLYYLFLADKIKPPKSMAFLIGASAFSGVTAGLFSIGGPLIVLTHFDRFDTREEYIASTQLLFGLNNVLCTIIRGLIGTFSAELIPFSLLGIVFISLGRAAGIRISGHLSMEKMKKMVYAGVLISGIINIVNCI